MKTKLFAVVSALAVLGVASPASAVIVDVTYTGTVTSSNYFGDTWVANYVFDTTKGNYNESSPTNNYVSGFCCYYGDFNPALSATVTINGSTTFSVNPNYEGRIAASNFGSESQQLHTAVYEDVSSQKTRLLSNHITAFNGNISPSITGPYHYTAMLRDEALGSYIDGIQLLSIYASLQTVTVSSDLATPLPAALPLFASGLGVMGLLARRRKRKATAVLAAV